MHRAQPLLLELEKIVIRAPALDGAAAPALQVVDCRKIFTTLHTTFARNRLLVEAMLRQLTPSNEWSILPAFCERYLQLIKHSSGGELIRAFLNIVLDIGDVVFSAPSGHFLPDASVD